MDMVGTSNLILKISEYAMQQERFTLSQVRAALKLDDVQYEFLQKKLVALMDANADNPNQILCFVHRPPSNNGNDVREDEYSLLPNAMFNYIDWIEVKEAKKYAREARYLSIIAIVFTAASVAFPFIDFLKKDKTLSQQETKIVSLSNQVSNFDSLLTLKDQRLLILNKQLDSLSQKVVTLRGKP